MHEKSDDLNLEILVAEDSSLSFTLITAMIERVTGTAPDWARNGEEAVEMVQQKFYDLVFMDYFMPAMSGIEATRSIRQVLPLWEQPTIVGISGATAPMDIRACLEAGMDHFLAKPLRLIQIENILKLARTPGERVFVG
jgi:CheY-like chemotaxis protein